MAVQLNKLSDWITTSGYALLVMTNIPNIVTASEQSESGSPVEQIV